MYSCYYCCIFIFFLCSSGSMNSSSSLYYSCSCCCQQYLSGDFTVDVINVVMLLLVVDIAIVLFAASEMWLIVDTLIASVRMKLCQ